MPSLFGRQLRAMIRKNYIVKKRRKCATLGELITPLLFCMVLALLTGQGIERILEDQAGRCKTFVL